MINTAIAGVNQHLSALFESANHLATIEKPPKKEITAFIQATEVVSASIRHINIDMNLHAFKRLSVDDLAELHVAYKTMENKLCAVKRVIEHTGGARILGKKKLSERSKTSLIFGNALILLGEVAEKSELLKVALKEKLDESRNSSSASGPQSARELKSPGPLDDSFEKPLPRRAFSDIKIKEKMISSMASEKGKKVKSPHVEIKGLDGSIDDLPVDLTATTRSQRDKVLSFINFLDDPIALGTIGLFRESPNEDHLQAIKAQADSLPNFAIPEGTSVHIAARLIKMTMSEIELPLSFLQVMMEGPQVHKGDFAAKAFNAELANEQKETLIALMDYLTKVIKNSAVNKMKIDNLAIVFAPTIFKIPKGVNAQQYMALEPASRNAFTTMLTAYIDNPDAFHISGTRFLDAPLAGAPPPAPPQKGEPF